MKDPKDLVVVKDSKNPKDLLVKIHKLKKNSKWSIIKEKIKDIKTITNKKMMS